MHEFLAILCFTNVFSSTDPRWRVVAVIGLDAVSLAPVAREESNAQVAYHLKAGNA